MRRGSLIALAWLTSFCPSDAVAPDAWAGFRLARPVFQVTPFISRVDVPHWAITLSPSSLSDYTPRLRYTMEPTAQDALHLDDDIRPAPPGDRYQVTPTITVAQPQPDARSTDRAHCNTPCCFPRGEG
jgi:hypothetical protein